VTTRASQPQPEPSTGQNLDALLRVAREAARRAGDLLRERFAAPARDVHTKSGPRDFVSAADLAAEQSIRALLASERRGDGVLGEEYGETPSSTGLRWVIDPLDGTVNYLRRIPHWSVSVACEDSDGPLVGVVRHPLRGECFSAVRGRGADLNGAQLRGSSATDLSLAAVGGEFSAWSDAQAEAVRRLVSRAGYMRNFGSTALDLAWGAAGRWDAVYHGRFPKPWDRAAGVLLCREAGLVDVRVNADDSGEPRMLVAPPALMDQLLDAVTPG
jgi:myo-inositol-1(or 4)-monophosphatase